MPTTPRSLLVFALAVCWSPAVLAQEKADGAKRPATDPFTRNAAEHKAAVDAYTAGKYKEALELYTIWRPNTGCGTCNEQMESERVLHLALCHAHLKDYAATVGDCYKATRKYNGRQAAVAVFLFELYRDADQLADLKTLFELDDLGLTDSVTETLRELFRLRTLREKKDLAELIKVCQNSGSTSSLTSENPFGEWRCRAAAEALAACGEDAVKPLAEAIDSRKQSMSWLIYALGKHPSAKALDALVALVEKESGGNSGNVAYAISLHGEAGRRELQVIAKQPNRGVYLEADNILKGKFKVESPPDYPKPKAGSLPKELFK